jgi:oligopeptide/dipeptide ABC transporter ATP-binding protein
LAREAALLEVKELKKYYSDSGQGFARTSAPVVKAVDGVSFSIARGETFGLVGESGCGKSTTGRSILRLTEPTAGSVTFDGMDVLGLSRSGLRAARRQMQIIFQDPYSSLNPRMTVGDIIEEPLIIHRVGTRNARRDRVADLLGLVGLSVDHVSRYPHEFSGGQRQRIGIARAIALNPKLIVCDEPVSALDVSVQAQIVNLLQDLQDRLSLTYLFISHGLAVVRHIADRVAIMYAGKLVEVATSEEIFSNPLHPYTKLLLSSIPNPDPGGKRQRSVVGLEIKPDASDWRGCSFAPRCPLAKAICLESAPELQEVSPGHFVSCFAIASEEEK